MKIRTFLLPIFAFLSGSNVFKYFEKTKEMASWDKEALSAYQHLLLKKLLIHAHENVEYYSNLFDIEELMNADGTINLKKFAKIPVLTKEQIRKSERHLLSNDLSSRKTYTNSSGGSTGRPLRLVQDNYYQDWNFATKLFYAYWLGKQPGEKEIKFWGSERDILEGTIGFKDKIINFLYNRKFLNAFRMSASDIQVYATKWNSFKPKHVWVYVDTIFTFTKKILEQNIELYSPESIVTTAGVLTNPVRDLVEKNLNTKVYNQYGSREVGDMAAECLEQNGLHLFPWTHYLEFVDGKILVTLLTNYSMPLIRYEIGDTAELLTGSCKCGFASLRLKNVTGRTTDHFSLSDGTIIHGEYFTHLFYFRDWVDRFQVVQEEYELVKCIVQLSKKPNIIEIRQITSDIKAVMGSDCRVSFKFVKKINPSPSGKYLYTFSKVSKV